MLLDKINCQILDLLQENCRMSLTDIAKDVNLSIDSVKKRINRMHKENVFFPQIQLRPRNFGFKNIVEIKIKLHDYTREDYDKLINTLKEHPLVVELFETSGDMDLMIVIISKDAIHQGKVCSEIRNGFSKIIMNWSEYLTTNVYKFENYDMKKVREHL